MKITNISKALQGVHTKSGRVFIRPGETKDLELTDAGMKQARRLKGLVDVETGKAERPKLTDAGMKAVHHGGGKFNVVEGDTVHLQGLSKTDADGFNAMSDADKKTYVETEKTKA